MISLDSNDWAKLTHAYGVAKDTPRLLRALRASRPTEDRAIWDELAGSLQHQGDLCPAMYAAAPHLADMLAGAPLERQVDVLTFLEPVLGRRPDAKLYGQCLACCRSVHFVIDGDEIVEIESRDGSRRTPQRIVTPSRVRGLLDEGRTALGDVSGVWDAPWVFAAGAALAQEVARSRLADTLIAFDTTIACSRCGDASRVVTYA